MASTGIVWAPAGSDATQIREQFLARRRAALGAVLDHAVERGELPDRAAAATLLDLVLGSLWYRLIFDIGPLDQAWADAITDTIAGSLGAAPPAGDPS